uniref:Uncharacterized protein n=1 Tax=Amphimedon queenslandica TaxID=400682 RepID=A0A1X7T8M6_AMPQE
FSFNSSLIQEIYFSKTDLHTKLNSELTLTVYEGGFKTPPPGGMYKCGEYFLELDEFKAAIAVTVSPILEPTLTITTTRTRTSQVIQTTTEAGPTTTSTITRTTTQTRILTTTIVTATNAPTVTITIRITVTATPTSGGIESGRGKYSTGSVWRREN